MANPLKKLYRKYLRRSRGTKATPEGFEAYLETLPPRLRGFTRRRGRTRESRRWTQWVAYKARYATGRHRAVPKLALGRLLETFRSVEAE